jgi:hypothetical protein
MTDLSPAAQTVIDAFLKTPGEEPMPGWNYRRDIAAALRAAADQVVPEEEAMPLNLAHRVRWDAIQSVRFQLLAIAAELETFSK